jgi:hypothetical protein
VGLAGLYAGITGAKMDGPVERAVALGLGVTLERFPAERSRRSPRRHPREGRDFVDPARRFPLSRE